MSMIALAWNEDTQRIDLQSKAASFLSWLENAVTISIYTDARADADDELPDGGTDQRGYWGDMELPEGESLGNKLWLLKREKVTQPVINKAREYCNVALQWLVDADHLQAVDVVAERDELNRNRINFLIQCQLLDGRWIEPFREHFDVI